MKILIALNATSTRGGATRSCAYLAKGLQDKGHEVLVVFPGKVIQNELYDELGVRYTYIKNTLWVHRNDFDWVGKAKYYMGLLFNRLIALPRFKELLARESFDLVAVNNSWVYVAGLAAIDLNIPLVWHIREYTEEDFPDYKFGNKDKSLKTIAQADKIIAVSQGVAAKYRNLTDASKVTCIYNGISEGSFYRQKRSLFRDEIVKMVIASRVCQTKGQEDLINALGLLKEECGFERFLLDVVGGGSKEDVEKLKALSCERGLSGHVRFIGSVSDVAPFYQRSDISFTCSRSEAFGRVTVEAMMSGCLVIASDSGANPELIEDGKTGYLYTSCSSRSLAETIMRALENRIVANDVALAGQSFAMEHFTAADNTAAIEKAYIDAVQSHGQSHKPVVSSDTGRQHD